MSVSARWITPADPSVNGLVTLAASYGVPIGITEFRRTPAGVLKAGAPRVCHPEEFTVLVTLPPAATLPFPAAAIECVLRRGAPARCALVFDYSVGAPVVWGLSLWNDGSVWG